ncbi:VOC family protein [Williamsia sterculiae]|uniref:Catechol-2,3-dioxygenase n=1 Tax=Williamsia sterculiae TaxID=1344003 RepID=A0A1N7FT67_9NOCA|nr:hypothetical protein [Williamsia sterculiae]SIS03538.1 Catechol-2,3-dioxygenase [Williamsia sterculiae]
MEMISVRLPTRTLAETADYFESWGCVITPAMAGEVTVRIGHSRITFVGDREFVGDHHLAFTVPTGAFDAAKHFISQRVALLRRNGIEDFECPVSWNARSVYFDGPDGQLLEFIERRDRADRIDHPFTTRDLVSVSEIGIAVPDVLETVSQLEASGLSPYGDPPTPGFAAVGDVDGLLIIVPHGRVWRPTDNRVAAQAHVDVISDAGVVWPPQSSRSATAAS